MSVLSSVQRRAVITVYKCSRTLVTSLKTVQKEESNETSTYGTVDLYSQLKSVSKWMHKSLDFSMLSRIDASNKDSFIDLACGTGEFCRTVADEYNCKTIVGVDKSVDMIMKARELSFDLQHKRITFKLDDCSSMDEKFMNDFESFDVVACQWLYLYANNIGQLSQMIANAAALLKSGGVHVGCTRNPLKIADDGMDGFSENWKEFGLETIATAEMIKNGRNHFIDGEISIGNASALKLNDFLHNEREIGINCIEFMAYFYSMETYNKLFAKHGFCDIHWLTGNDHLAHPCLSQLEQEKYQRYMRNNPSHAIFVMRKK